MTRIIIMFLVLSFFSCEFQEQRNLDDRVSEDMQKSGLKLSEEVRASKYDIFYSAIKDTMNLTRSNINFEIYDPLPYPVENMFYPLAYKFLRAIPKSKNSNFDQLTVAIFRNGVKNSKTYSISEMYKSEQYLTIISEMATKIQRNKLSDLHEYFEPELRPDVTVFTKNINLIDSLHGRNTISTIRDFRFDYHKDIQDSVIFVDFIVANEKYQTKYSVVMRKSDKKIIGVTIN